MKNLNQISNHETNLFGGKGASLGELSKIDNVKVPNGFVISTRYNKSNFLKFKEKIFQKFYQLESEFIAVRSSATKEDSIKHSFAGQFDTFLNVKKEKVLHKISQCYDSIKSPRIISYCEVNNIKLEEIEIAVVIQEMIQSEVSGVAFSSNPINNNKDEIVIEAGFGLGEYIVSGIITPDKYIYCKKENKTKEIVINYQEYQLVNQNGVNTKKDVALEKQNSRKLNNNQLGQLLKSIINIETHYKQPMDIEWALYKNQIYITQARPITTLK